jgi:hypothetical protein
VLHALLAKAKKEGWTADQVMIEAEKVGAPITDEGFKTFVRSMTEK